MKIKYLLFLSLVCLFLISCKPETSAPVNQSVPPAVNSNVRAANVETNTATTNTIVFSSLATPSDTFKSHYAALAANNDTLLRKTLSAGMLQLYGSLYPDKKIVEIMREMLKNQGETTDTPPIVSEKISGNNAVVKWKAGDGTIVDQPLLKESDGWKMAMGK